MKIWKRNVIVLFAVLLLGGYFGLSWIGAGWQLMLPQAVFAEMATWVIRWTGAAARPQGGVASTR